MNPGRAKTHFLFPLQSDNALTPRFAAKPRFQRARALRVYALALCSALGLGAAVLLAPSSAAAAGLSDGTYSWSQPPQETGCVLTGLTATFKTDGKATEFAFSASIDGKAGPSAETRLEKAREGAIFLPRAEGGFFSILGGDDDTDFKAQFLAHEPLIWAHEREGGFVVTFAQIEKNGGLTLFNARYANSDNGPVAMLDWRTNDCPVTRETLVLTAE